MEVGGEAALGRGRREAGLGGEGWIGWRWERLGRMYWVEVGVETELGGDGRGRVEWVEEAGEAGLAGGGGGWTGWRWEGRLDCIEVGGGRGCWSVWS